jgi:hypothetical protein
LHHWQFYAKNKISELDTPTIARLMPVKIERWYGFSATNEVKARLHQTEPPNAMTACMRKLVILINRLLKNHDLQLAS